MLVDWPPLYSRVVTRVMERNFNIVVQFDINLSIGIEIHRTRSWTSLIEAHSLGLVCTSDLGFNERDLI